MKGWKAWYTDRREFDSRNDEWEQLPDDGVLAVLVFEDETYTRYCDGQDWYFMHKGTICCNNDRLSENKRRYPGSVFKRGKWTSDERMKQIQRQAEECEYFF